MLGNVVIGVPLAFTILAVLVVALRIYIRARIKAGLGWDDWTMLLAVVSNSNLHHHACIVADIADSHVLGDRNRQPGLVYNGSGV